MHTSNRSRRDVVVVGARVAGAANALIRPALFACADAAPRAELASGSAVLATSRQLGSALGVAIFVAVIGGHAAGACPGSTVPGIVVIITAVLTAAGPAAGRRRKRAPEQAASAETAGDAASIACATSQTRGNRIDCRGF